MTPSWLPRGGAEPSLSWPVPTPRCLAIVPGSLESLKAGGMEVGKGGPPVLCYLAGLALPILPALFFLVGMRLFVPEISL